MMPRYSIELTNDEAEQVKAIAVTEDRTMASTLRCLVRRQLQVGNLLENSANCLKTARICVESAQNPQSPGPDHARARGSDSNKKGNKKGDKNKKPEAQLAPLDIATRIVVHLNSIAGSTYKPTGRKIRELIANRLRDGFTEEDFLEVHRKKVREWKGTDMERYLTFETLYSLKFEKYLGQPEVGPQRQIALTEGERRTERNIRKGEPGYHTNSGGPENIDLTEYIPF